MSVSDLCAAGDSNEAIVSSVSSPAGRRPFPPPLQYA